PTAPRNKPTPEGRNTMDGNLIAAGILFGPAAVALPAIAVLAHRSSKEREIERAVFAQLRAEGHPIPTPPPLVREPAPIPAPPAPGGAPGPDLSPGPRPGGSLGTRDRPGHAQTRRLNGHPGRHRYRQASAAPDGPAPSRPIDPKRESSSCPSSPLPICAAAL